MKYLIILLFTTNLMAQECPKYKSLDKGESAPCKGSFFSKKAEQKLKDNYSKLEKSNENLNKQLKLADLEVTLHKEKSGIWEKEANNQAEYRRLQKWDYTKGFLMGTGGAILMFFINSLVIKASE